MFIITNMSLNFFPPKKQVHQIKLKYSKFVAHVFEILLKQHGNICIARFPKLKVNP